MALTPALPPLCPLTPALGGSLDPMLFLGRREKVEEGERERVSAFS